MKNHTLINALAWAGAVIVMFGVTFAARLALAEETRPEVATVSEQSITAAREATERAVQEAAQAVAEETEVELELRLSAHTSDGSMEGQEAS